MQHNQSGTSAYHNIKHSKQT